MAQPRQKGKRMVDRFIPIRLYSTKEESSGKDEEKEEVTFTTVVDSKVSEKNKTAVDSD